MGRYTITIIGQGPHGIPGHPPKPEDADVIGKDLVADLKQGGHQIESADIHYGSERLDLLAEDKADEGKT